MARKIDIDILAELSGHMSPTDLSLLTNRELSGGAIGRENGRPSPGAARHPLVNERIVGEQVLIL